MYILKYLQKDPTRKKYTLAKYLSAVSPPQDPTVRDLYGADSAIEDAVPLPSPVVVPSHGFSTLTVVDCSDKIKLGRFDSRNTISGIAPVQK